MNNEMIKEYMVNYADPKKSISTGAILLTGEWGAGKSYFVQNELIKHLEANERKVVLISLYETQSIEDICRLVFWKIYGPSFFKQKGAKTQ